MANEVSAIRETFNTFVKAWEKCDLQGLNKVILPTCKVDYSIFKKDISVEEFKKELVTRTKKVTYSRFETYNFVCSHNKTKAAISAAIQGLFVNEEDKPTNFSFNGFITDSLVKTEDGWKFDNMRFILGSESDNHARLKSNGISVDNMDGDVDFVKNWHLIDFNVGWHKDVRMISIVPEEDCPWYAIKDRVNKETDEEQIKECFFRYCYGLDCDCVELYDDVFSKTCNANYSGNRLYDKRSVTAMLRYEREGMIGMGHIMAFSSIDINGNIAKAHVYRAGYLPGGKLKGDLKYLNHVIARYDLVFIKEDDKWLIDDLRYYPGRLVVPFSKDTFISETDLKVTQ